MKPLHVHQFLMIVILIIVQSLWISRFSRPSQRTTTTSAESQHQESKQLAKSSTKEDPKFPITNILLMGQFNFDTSLDKILMWIKIWSKYFTNISVVGPFSQETYENALQLGLDIHLGADDGGYVSPVENLVNALVRAQDGIDAVLYLHDDALLNLTALLDEHGRIPTDRIIGILPVDDAVAYSITIPENSTGEIFYQNLFDGNRTPTTDSGAFLRELATFHKWYFARLCIDGISKMLRKGNEIYDYATSKTDQESRFMFVLKAQVDFLLVPVAYRETTFVRLAKLFVESSVFLECALPNIVFWFLQHEMRWKNASSAEYYSSPTIFRHDAMPVTLCTSFSFRLRGYTSMIHNCIRKQESGYAMYHPFKLSLHSAKNFSLWLDRVQHPWNNSYYDD